MKTDLTVCYNVYTKKVEVRQMKRIKTPCTKKITQGISTIIFTSVKSWNCLV